MKMTSDFYRWTLFKDVAIHTVTESKRYRKGKCRRKQRVFPRIDYKNTKETHILCKRDFLWKMKKLLVPKNNKQKKTFELKIENPFKLSKWL